MNYDLKVKHNRMRGSESGFVGIIPDKDTFERVSVGELTWKETVHHKMKSVQVPKDLFYELVRIYNEYMDMKEAEENEDV